MKKIKVDFASYTKSNDFSQSEKEHWVGAINEALKNIADEVNANNAYTEVYRKDEFENFNITMKAGTEDLKSKMQKLWSEYLANLRPLS